MVSGCTSLKKAVKSSNPAYSSGRVPGSGESLFLSLYVEICVRPFIYPPLFLSRRVEKFVCENINNREMGELCGGPSFYGWFDSELTARVFFPPTTHNCVLSLSVAIIKWTLGEKRSDIISQGREKGLVHSRVYRYSG